MGVVESQVTWAWPKFTAVAWEKVDEFYWSILIRSELCLLIKKWEPSVKSNVFLFALYPLTSLRTSLRHWSHSSYAASCLLSALPPSWLEFVALFLLPIICDFLAGSHRKWTSTLQDPSWSTSLTSDVEKCVPSLTLKHLANVSSVFSTFSVSFKRGSKQGQEKWMILMVKKITIYWESIMGWLLGFFRLGCYFIKFLKMWPQIFIIISLFYLW